MDNILDSAFDVNIPEAKSDTREESVTGSHFPEPAHLVSYAAGEQDHGLYAFLHICLDPFPCDLLKTSCEETDAVVEHFTVGLRLEIGVKEKAGPVLDLS